MATGVGDGTGVGAAVGVGVSVGDCMGVGVGTGAGAAVGVGAKVGDRTDIGVGAGIGVKGGGVGSTHEATTKRTRIRTITTTALLPDLPGHGTRPTNSNNLGSGVCGANI